MKSRLIILMLCAIHMFAMDQGRTTVGGPVAGFVFDGNVNAVRPMLGLPGAAYLGSPVVEGLEAAGIAPDGSRALAVREGRLYLITGLKTGEAAAKAVEGAVEGADLFAWAADGSAAVAYASRTRQAQIIREAAAGEALDLSALPGTVVSLALSASGKLIAGVVGEESGGVYLAADARLLAAAGYPAAMVAAGQDLFFADRDRDQICQVLKFEEQPAAVVFAAGVSAPVGVQVYGGQVFAAGSGGLDIFDLASRASAAHIGLEFAPTGLASFGERALWLMNAPKDGEPLYVLSAAGAPAVYFVPAGREE